MDLELPGPGSLSQAGLPALAADGAQPRDDAQADLAGAARAAGAGRAVSPDLRRRARGPRRHTGGARYLVAAGACRRERLHRLLLRRVRASPVASDLRRWAGRAGRRSLQGSERPRDSAHRRRLHVPARVFPSDGVAGRVAAGSSTSAWTGPTRRSSPPSGPTAGPASSRYRSGIARCSCRSGRCCSAASSSSSSTRISRRTRPGIASCRRASTAAIARRASSRKSSSASAASASSRPWASSRRPGI